MITTKPFKPTKKIVTSILSIVDVGLTKGAGTPEPGKLCVEAAICLALGLPHGDEPPCVGSAVRSFKISLNDSAWSSDKARAKGMRRLAIAQLGSDTIDQNLFVKELALATIRKIVPLALRAAGKINPTHKELLETHANKCESVGDDLNAASYAARAARAASYAARAARAASYAARAARAASYAARAASYAASDAASYASYASDARAASYAARAARAASDASDAARDEVLTLMANIGLETLIKCKSPGCKWIFLCDAENKKSRKK